MEKSLRWRIFAVTVTVVIITVSVVELVPSFEKARSNTVEISFTEAGLPSNHTWSGEVINYVTINGTFKQVVYGFSTSNKSYYINVTNFQSDIYWQVNSTKQYEATNSSGYVQKITSRIIRVEPNFMKSYLLTFQGKGKVVPLLGQLDVYTSKQYQNINNYPVMAQPMFPLEEKGNSSIFRVINGTYYYHLNSYSVNASAYLPLYNNTVNVNGYAFLSINGSNATVPISYTTHLHYLNVTEKGFPPNQPGWNFSIDGGQTESYSNHYGGYYLMVFFLPNGVYQYSAETINGYQASNGFGTVKINGSNIPMVINYG